MKDADALLGAAERAVRRALAQGAEEAEAFLWNSEGAGAHEFGGLLFPKSYEELGVAVRVAVRGRVGLGSLMGGADEALEEAVESALEATRARPADPAWRGFADPEKPALRGAWDDRVRELTLEDLLRETRDMAERLRGAPEIRFTNANNHAYAYQVAVANSRGVAAHDRGTVHSVKLEVRAGRGAEERTMERTLQGRGVQDWHGAPEEVARLALEGLGAKPLPRGARTVVFDPDTSWVAGFLLGHALSGRRARLQQTPLAGKAGERVYSPALTVEEDPARGFRGAAIDDEGVPTRARPLVEGGVLRSYLWDTYAARAAGVPGTGNGVRAAPRYQNAPAAGPMNLVVRPGRGTFEDLVAEVADGVLVRGFLMGYGQSNVASGDFSLVAPCAWRIEGGRVTHPLPRTSIAGNLHEALRDVRGIGADARNQQAYTVPSLALGGIATSS